MAKYPDREEKKDNGTAFKAVMMICFASGAAVYIHAASFAGHIAGKIGFIAIALFSLMAAAAMVPIDMKMTRYMRDTTKISAVLIPVSVNGGSAAAGLCLSRGWDAAAVIIAVIACIAYILCGSLLIKRYRADDL